MNLSDTVSFFFHKKKTKKKIIYNLFVFTYYKWKKTAKLKFLWLPKMYLGVDLTSGSCQDHGVLFPFACGRMRCGLERWCWTTTPFQSMNLKWRATEMILMARICKTLHIFQADCLLLCKHLLYLDINRSVNKQSESLNLSSTFLCTDW